MSERAKHIPVHDFSEDDASSIPFQFLALEDKEDHDVSVPHRHNYYEIFIFNRGPGRHMIDFEQYPIEAGSIHFVSPGQVHQVQRKKGSFGKVIFFSRDFLLSNSSNKHLLFELPYLNSNGRPVMQLSKGEMQELAPILAGLQKESEGALDYGEEIVRAQLHVLLLKCQRYYAARKPLAEADTPPSKMRDFRVALEQNFRELHQVQDYAALLHTNTKSLNQLCKEASGKTASECIFDRILLEAKRLLIHSEWSVKEVAVFLNYEDPAHFSKFFKKYTGQSPSEFREAQ